MQPSRRQFSAALLTLLSGCASQSPKTTTRTAEPTTTTETQPTNALNDIDDPSWPTYLQSSSRNAQGQALTTPVEQQWSVRSDGSFLTPPSQPLASDDTLVLTHPTAITARHLTTGRTRWHQSAPDDTGFTNRSLIHDGTVTAVTPNTVRQYHQRTGSIQRTVTTPREATITTAPTATPEGLLIGTTTPNQLLRLDTAGLTAVSTLPDTPQYITTLPTATTVLVRTSQTLTAIDAQSGDTQWQLTDLEPPANGAAPVTDGQHVITTDGNGRLKRCRSVTGEITHTVPVADTALFTPYGMQDAVYTTDVEGVLHKITFGETPETTAWTPTVESEAPGIEPGEVDRSPVAAGSKLLYPFGRALVAFDVPTQQFDWHRTFEYRPAAPPTPVEGALFLNTVSELHALQ